MAKCNIGEYSWLAADDSVWVVWFDFCKMINVDHVLATTVKSHTKFKEKINNWQALIPLVNWCLMKLPNSKAVFSTPRLQIYCGSDKKHAVHLHKWMPVQIWNYFALGMGVNYNIASYLPHLCQITVHVTQSSRNIIPSMPGGLMTHEQKLHCKLHCTTT